MRVLYVSPSTMPSRSASSVHVAQMCEAFGSLGCTVTLCFHRSRAEDGVALREAIEDHYGVSFRNVELCSYASSSGRAVNLRIAWMTALQYRRYVRAVNSRHLLLSRNLYASFLLRPSRGAKVVFETHGLERGFRKHLQAAIMRRPGTRTVVISEALKRALAEHHGFEPPVPAQVLHDAARAGQVRFSAEEKARTRRELLCGLSQEAYRYLAGYFGHLYEGRGVEIIRALAALHPDVAFLVYGGNDLQIEALRREANPENFKILGYLSPSRVPEAMAMMDVLLMPYQRSVSIGTKDSDTARWMSPLKMFEYMAAGVPIIASDLPVLREVLSPERNCLLATADDPASWSSCLGRLFEAPGLAETLASRAHSEYVQTYNWTSRARRILAFSDDA